MLTDSSLTPPISSSQMRQQHRNDFQIFSPLFDEAVSGQLKHKQQQKNEILATISKKLLDLT